MAKKIVKINSDSVEGLGNGRYFLLDTKEYLHVSNGNKHYYKNKGYSILHRENNLPAIEYANGAKIWYVNGKLHRENGPACESNEVKQWFLFGEYNREDGPAIEYKNGAKYWYLNGEKLSEEEHKKMTAKESDYSKDGSYFLPTGEYLEVSNGNKYYHKNKDYTIFHRENDLPAIEYAGGGKRWMINDKYHRENGPAVEFSNGNKEWWVNDKHIPATTQAEFEKYMKFKHFF